MLGDEAGKSDVLQWSAMGMEWSSASTRMPVRSVSAAKWRRRDGLQRRLGREADRAGKTEQASDCIVGVSGRASDCWAETR